MPKTRGILIAGNWKMNHGPKETDGFFEKLKGLIGPSLVGPERGLEVCIAPPCLSLNQAIKNVTSMPIPITIAAQNAHWEKSGAFTGEISGPMLEEIGISTVIIGHSERRHLFGETNATVHRRATNLLNQGFRVILCVGETKEERSARETNVVLADQLAAVLQNPGEGAANFLDGRLVLAYEPVWAIGTGLTATPKQAEDAHQFIRKFIWDHFGLDASAKTPIIYGGSVTAQNIFSLLSQANIDGALIGGASLNPENIVAFMEAGQKVMS